MTPLAPEVTCEGSLKRHLLMTLLLVLPAVWLSSALLNLYAAHHQVSELFDTEQAFFAQMLASLNVEAQHSGLTIRPTSPRRLRELFEDESNGVDDDIVFQLRDHQGRVVLTDVNYTELPFQRDFVGFIDQKIDGRTWRLFYLHDHDNGAYVVVGQRMTSRVKLIWRLAISQLIPWLAALPVLLFGMWWGVRRGLRPLARLTKELSLREPANLAPFTQPVPEEVQPLVMELNHLLARLGLALDKERRFTADAAHELRTPLAALRIQTEVAQLSEDDESRQRALNQVLAGIDRATRLVEQLLTLARLDHLSDVSDRQPVALGALLTQLMTEMNESAQRRQITLELPNLTEDWTLDGSPGFLLILFRNLIGNAILYVPQGGRVWVELSAGRLAICDNGLGVAPEWLERVRERFSRPEGQAAEGSGLGLSIAERIATLHGLHLRFSNRSEGGFCAALTRVCDEMPQAKPR